MLREFFNKYLYLNTEGTIFVGILFLIIFYFFFLKGHKYEKR